MNYKKLYENIMDIDKQIRFATIFDVNGQIKCCWHQKGIKNISTTQESKKSLEETANGWKSHNEYLHKIGEGKYVLTLYENIKRITIPLDPRHLLYLTTEDDADHVTIIDKALQIKQG